MGFGGLIGCIVSFWIWDIYFSYYGCICLIDIFEGINVGFIGFLVIYVRIGYWGFLESFFYEIFERLIGVWMFYLLLGRDEYYMVVVGNFLVLN